MTNARRFFIYPLLLTVVAMVVAKSAPAAAADLNDGDYSSPAATDDQRYRDIYEYPPPRAQVRQYEEKYEERSYRVRDHATEERVACLRPHEIERALNEEGWNDIDDLDFGTRYIHVDARDGDTGREFELTLDRCSGRIVQAEPGYHPPPRRYGYRD